MKTIPWIDDIAQLVGKVGSPAFNETFYSLFERALSIAHCTVFSFPPSGPPTAILVEAGSAELKSYTRQLAALYVAGEYERDPSIVSVRSHVMSVRSLCATDIADRCYRRCFYDEPGIAHKLALHGSLDDTSYHLSFYRTTVHTPFTSQDVETLAALGTFALQLINRHVELMRCVKSEHDDTAILPREKRERLFVRLKEVLLAEPHMLSPREAEICAGIILGYTTLGLSLNLGISINTVATHRKRAYQKLGVSRQNELFSRYYELVNRLH